MIEARNNRMIQTQKKDDKEIIIRRKDKDNGLDIKARRIRKS